MLYCTSFIIKYIGISSRSECIQTNCLRKIMCEEIEHIKPQIEKWEDDWKNAHDGNLPSDEER